ncbi:MAG: ABC transporter permease subunit, partial [Rubrivivax sp.]
MTAARWRRAMNSAAGQGAWPRVRSLPAAAGAGGALAPVAPPDPYADSDAPRWLKFLWRTLSARHVLVLLGVIVFPFVATPFLTFQVGAQALVLGLIALSLTFLGGYGGMVSLAQMSVAGMAGYAVAIFGASSTPISLGWPWWVAVPFATVIATACATVIGWLSV